MKKISTLLVSSLFSLSLLAYDGSRLSISTVSNNTGLKVEIDGRRLSMKDNSITLSNIAEGYHQVKIFREKRKTRDWYRDEDRNKMEDRNGVDDRSFEAGRSRDESSSGFYGKRMEVIYSSSIYVKRGFHTDITVNRFGKVFVDESRIDRNSDYEDDENYDDGGGWDNGYGNVMSSRDFDIVKEQIRKEWFENNKLTSVKTIVDKNNFTAQQVKEMMLLFVFENNKLEVAKYAYRKTVDKKNYFMLNDALTFSSSKQELARFIREFR